MLLNCGVGEDSCESLGLQGDLTSQSSRKSVLNIHWKDWCWSWNSNTSSTWCEELTHWKRPLCWKKLKAGGEGDNRGWDGWMAPPTQWTWVWINPGNWWWTRRSGVLQSMGSQNQTQLGDWTELTCLLLHGFPLSFLSVISLFIMPYYLVFSFLNCPTLMYTVLTSIVLLTSFSFCWHINKVSSPLGASFSGMTSLSVTLLFRGVIPTFSSVYVKFNLNPFLLLTVSKVGRSPEQLS